MTAVVRRLGNDRTRGQLGLAGRLADGGTTVRGLYDVTGMPAAADRRASIAAR